MLLWTILAACSGADSDGSGDTDEDPGACGEISRHDVTVTGRVEKDGEAVSGAAVSLVDEGWEPGTVLGDATTADGAFTLVATDVVDAPSCWGSLLDYRLRATDGDASAEMPINPSLHEAILDGSLAVDLTTTPLALE